MIYRAIPADWLQTQASSFQISPLKLQAFEFLCAAFSRSDGEDTGNRTISTVSASCDRAEAAAFLVQILSEAELSELLHKFDAWLERERQACGRQSARLDSAVFSDRDLRLASELRKLYPLEMIRSSTVIQRKDSAGQVVSFVIGADDASRLTAQQQLVLTEVALLEPLPVHNPLFVEIDPNGYLVID